MSKIKISDISVTGSPSSSTYLRGDGSWNTPSGGSGGGSPVDGNPVTRPSLASLVWVNQGGSTAVDNSGGPITMTVTTQSGDQLRCLELTSVPATTPWTVTAKVSWMWFAQSYYTGGLYIRDTSGKMVSLNLSEASNYIQVNHWNSPTSYGSNSYQQNILSYSTLWLRVYNDGTNFNFYISPNGADWLLIYTESNTSFLGTIAAAGFYGDNNAGSGPESLFSLWSLEWVTGTGTNSSW